MTNLTYIRLKNFSVILNCLNREEIVIDRSDSPNVLILLKGPNGIGKSSILSELSPLALEHTNSRSIKRTLKDKIAEKELHFVVNNSVKYICKIIYTNVKTSAYLAKKDLYEDDSIPPLELNPNGNISSYEDLLERELGFNKNYVKIGYLSPDITNFLGMKPTERSNFISSMLPDISMFLKAYEVVSKKANEKKREIDNINKELGKLSTINYETHLEQLKLSIDNINKSLDKTKEDITKNNIYLENLGKYQNLFIVKDKLKQEFLMKSNQLDIEYNKITMTQSLIEKYNCENGSDLLHQDLINLEKELTKLRENQYQCEVRIEKLTLSIREKSGLIDKSSFDETLEDILNYIEKFEKELKEYQEEIKSLEEMNSNLISLFDNMNIDLVYEFSRIMDLIINYSNQLDSLSDIDNFNSLTKIVIDLETNISKTSVEIETIEKEINEIIEKISLLKSNEEMKKLYSLRDSCNSTGCRILQELEKYVNIDNERNLLIKNKELYIEKKDNLIKSKEYDLEKLSNIKKNIQIVNSINNIIKESSNSIVKFSEPLIKLFKIENILEIINRLKSIKIQFNDFREYIHLKEKITQISNSLNELKVKKTTVISKNSLEKEVAELEELQKKNILLEEQIQNLFKEKSELEKISETKKKIEKDISIYEKTRLELLEFKQKLINLASIEYYYLHLKDILVKLQCEKAIKERDLSELEKERESIKTEFINKTQLEKLRNELLEIKNKYEALANIWSHKTGYPSLIMENFLLKLKEDTNRDLAEIWDNSLFIEEFVLSQSEFAIIMNKNGMIIPDASQCSMGEKALLTFSLSLAVLEMNLKERKYNNVRIDELNSNFDEKRNSSFLRMVKERMERLGVQSCFIISHRDDTFIDTPADIILLNPDEDLNSPFYKNKNIIFKL